jgi:hypothetical protein
MKLSETREGRSERKKKVLSLKGTVKIYRRHIEA